MEGVALCAPADQVWVTELKVDPAALFVPTVSSYPTCPQDLSLSEQVWGSTAAVGPVVRLVLSSAGAPSLVKDYALPSGDDDRGGQTCDAAAGNCGYLGRDTAALPMLDCETREYAFHDGNPCLEDDICGFNADYSEYGGPCKTLEDQIVGALKQADPFLQAINPTKEEAAAQNDDVPTVEPFHEHLLRTAEADGEWKISLVPDPGFHVEGMPDFGSAKEVLGFSVAFPDHGSASQPTSYHSTNPVPDPTPYISRPPPTQEEIDEAWEDCYLAIATAVVVIGFFAAGAFLSGGVTGAQALFMMGTGATLGANVGKACGRAYEMSQDTGDWGAAGRVLNSWGGWLLPENCLCERAGSPRSRWDGNILDVPGILSLTSAIVIHDPVTLEVPYGNDVTTGYYEQQENYQQLETGERTGGWNLHNAYREQVGPSSATIQLHVPLIPYTQELVQAASPTFRLASTPWGDLFFSVGLAKFLLECPTGCGNDVVLSIESPGTGALTPGQEVVEVNFAGDPGAATINVLGVTLGGFTLDGELGGGAALGSLDSLPEPPEG